MPHPVTLADLNAMEQEAFTRALGALFEHSPWIVADTWQRRPFADTAALHAALAQTMYDATPAQQLALIRAHPDLAGKAAIAGELTAESTREQASAGLDRLTPAEYDEFTRLNDAYRTHFAMPFIICVREHTKTRILEQFRRRLHHTQQEEIATALGEVARIVRLRLVDLVHDGRAAE